MIGIKLKEVVKHFKLKRYNSDIDIDEIIIRNIDINRPGLELTGYFKSFDSGRIQVIGRSEEEYFMSLNFEERKSIISEFIEKDFPCIIFANDIEPFEELIGLNIPIFKTETKTTNFIGELIRFLRIELAPTITKHGELIDVYGEGILILGESASGKSEVALELVRRGHRLIADDVVQIKRAFTDLLIGYCPEVIRHFIEIRGIGILNIKELFGIEAVLERHTIDMVIKLIRHDDDSHDKFGFFEKYTTILDTKVPTIYLKVSPGRNLAVVIETAALNHRQRKMGYNAAGDLNEKVSKKLNE